MRFATILCLLIFCRQLCSGQVILGNDPNWAKFSLQNDTSNTNEIRRVPGGYRMGLPYYESLGSIDAKFVHYEFFRLDSAHYHVQEYFKNGRFKSIGVEAVDKNISDSVVVDVFLKDNPPKDPIYMSADHLLLKEGKWTEFDKDTLPSFFWKGIYLDNKRTGTWKHLLQLDKDFVSDTIVLEEIEYGRTGSPINYVGDGIGNRSLAELKNLLPGNWGNETGVAEGFDRYLKESVKWYIYWRGRVLTISDSYFEFNKSGKFVKHNGVCCDPTSNSYVGKWRLTRNGDQTFVDLMFKDGSMWQMKLLHYSETEGLIINLNKHPLINRATR